MHTRGEAQSTRPSSCPRWWARLPTEQGMEAVPSKSRTHLPRFPFAAGADISSCGFEHTRAGSCPRGSSLERDLLLAEPHFAAGHGPWGARPGQGVPAHPGLGGSVRIQPGPRPVSAPCQHLPAEPAQMLQECGSATTRYCRNASARRVGKGRAGALLPLLSPSPSTQQAAACAPCLGRGPPPLELESPRNPGTGCECFSPSGCTEPPFVTSPIALGWEMGAFGDTGANPVRLCCSE